MRRRGLAPLAVALVWLYQGLWCKLLGGCPGHRAIVAAVPGLGEAAGTALLLGLGLFETALALWVLSGWRPRTAALAQTALLAGMNGGGLLWARSHIADPGGLIVQNIAFLTLAWIVAARAGTATPDPGASPWRRGRLDGGEGPPRLLFGRMHEDWRIEAEVFPPGGRIFAIASAGSTATALAVHGFRVTAVDVNPVQLDYARERAAGGPYRPGDADRQMARARRFLPLLVPRREIAPFLELSSSREQARRWHERLETRRLRLALRLALHPWTLRVLYAGDFPAILPPRFDRIVRGRLARTFGLHSNRDNPFAWQLLLGIDPPTDSPDAPVSPPASPIAGAIDFTSADAADFLDRCPAGSFDGFTLSNVLDAAPPAYRQRLLAAVRRAAAPGAVAVLRSFLESDDPAAARWAARDRSPLWGEIAVFDAATGSPLAPTPAAAG